MREPSFDDITNWLWSPLNTAVQDDGEYEGQQILNKQYGTNCEVGWVRVWARVRVRARVRVTPRRKA